MLSRYITRGHGTPNKANLKHQLRTSLKYTDINKVWYHQSLEPTGSAVVECYFIICPMTNCHSFWECFFEVFDFDWSHSFTSFGVKMCPLIYTNQLAGWQSYSCLITACMVKIAVYDLHSTCMFEYLYIETFPMGLGEGNVRGICLALVCTTHCLFRHIFSDPFDRMISYFPLRIYAWTLNGIIH